MKIIWKITTQDVIDTNQKIIAQKLDPFDEFCVRYDILDDIFKMFDELEVSDDLEGLIKKGSYLMASIAWAQPFCGGNKRTAILITANFFHHNGIELIIPEDGKELRKLLYDIQEDRSGLNQSVMERIIFYISKTML